MIAAVLLASALAIPQDSLALGLTKLARNRDLQLQAGPWRAWLVCRGGELPFHLELQTDPIGAWIINGEERIALPRMEIEDDILTLGIDYYDSNIVAKIEDGGRRLRGTWFKRPGTSKSVEMDFHAIAGRGPRFSSQAPAAVTAIIDGRWAVDFDGDEYPAVGMFAATGDGRVSGTFLTALGDYRYLAGSIAGNRLRLSCFDGAHAFLFKARLDQHGALIGKFWSSNGKPQNWTAERDPMASLEDPYELTSWRPGDLDSLTFPDLEGKPHRLDDPTFAGKARLIVVFGSWCPNCKDETEYLVELHRRYRDRGLSILGLAFELSGDSARDRAQVQRYAEHHGIKYPILIAGIADKAAATKAFPVLDRVRSYPTTIFLSASGEVRAIHTGFSGPATGDDHAKLRQTFEAHIEALLK